MTILTTTQNKIENRIILLQSLTLAWMLVESSIALTAAWRAQSVSLFVFGSDSIVELISAAVVLLQFIPAFRISPTRAARACGILLYLLAAVVLAIVLDGLLHYRPADTSPLGIAITSGSLLLMPVLAYFKRDAAKTTGNKAVRADAVQSATCAYLAALTLSVLLVRAAFGLHWLDQVAALAAIPILIVEAQRARKGHVCSCCG